MEDTTSSSAGEEGEGILDDLNKEEDDSLDLDDTQSNVTRMEKKLQKDAGQPVSEEIKDIKRAAVDKTDGEDKLNEEGDLLDMGEDLDIPGSEQDDEEEEENNVEKNDQSDDANQGEIPVLVLEDEEDLTSMIDATLLQAIDEEEPEEGIENSESDDANGGEIPILIINEEDEIEGSEYTIVGVDEPEKAEVSFVGIDEPETQRDYGVDKPETERDYGVDEPEKDSGVDEPEINEVSFAGTDEPETQRDYGVDEPETQRDYGVDEPEKDSGVDEPEMNEVSFAGTDEPETQRDYGVDKPETQRDYGVDKPETERDYGVDEPEDEKEELYGNSGNYEAEIEFAGVDEYEYEFTLLPIGEEDDGFTKVIPNTDGLTDDKNEEEEEDGIQRDDVNEPDVVVLNTVDIEEKGFIHKN